MKDFDVKLFIAVLMTIVGASLLFVGLICFPLGEIHHSVLVAFGETSTFVAAVLGIDYSYRNAWNKFKKEIKEEAQTENKSE